MKLLLSGGTTCIAHTDSALQTSSTWYKHENYLTVPVLNMKYGFCSVSGIQGQMSFTNIYAKLQLNWKAGHDRHMGDSVVRYFAFEGHQWHLNINLPIYQRDKAWNTLGVMVGVKCSLL